MILKQDQDGKNYLSVTDEEIKELPPLTRVYHISATEKGIAPTDCKHDYIISKGVPMNIKGCKKCIYWDYTQEEPTAADDQN